MQKLVSYQIILFVILHLQSLEVIHFANYFTLNVQVNECKMVCGGTRCCRCASAGRCLHCSCVVACLDCYPRARVVMLGRVTVISDISSVVFGFASGSIRCIELQFI